jgi:hypothetical protein
MNNYNNNSNTQSRPGNREDNFSKNIQNVELSEVAEATLAFDKNSIFEQFESNKDSGIVKDAANAFPQTKFSSEPFSGDSGDDFFDKVSENKEESKRKREILAEQNKLNFETFGMTNAGNHNRSGGRGRGRGYKNYNNRGPGQRQVDSKRANNDELGTEGESAKGNIDSEIFKDK